MDFAGQAFLSLSIPMLVFALCAIGGSGATPDSFKAPCASSSRPGYAAGEPAPAGQQGEIPAPPSDHNLIYYQDSNGSLRPLPYESSSATARIDVAAKRDKDAEVGLKGAQATVVLTTPNPRFFLFVAAAPGSKPPFLVHLTRKHGSRGIGIQLQRGEAGFAVSSEFIVKPVYRVLEKTGNETFLEIRPRQPLDDGEYAFLGSDVARIATFAITQK